MQSSSFKVLSSGGIHNAKGHIYRKKNLNSHIAMGNTFLSPLYSNLFRVLCSKVEMKRSHLNPDKSDIATL